MAKVRTFFVSAKYFLNNLAQFGDSYYLCSQKSINDMTKTTLCEEEDRLIMYFEGRLDTPDTEKVKKDMEALFNCHDQDIVLDLTDLKYVCSGGLRLFLSLLKEGRQNGCSLTITGLNPYLRRVFNETGFARLFRLD